MPRPFRPRGRLTHIFLQSTHRSEHHDHLLLTPEQIKSFAPESRLGLHSIGGEDHFSLESTQHEAVAEYLILYDPGSGLHRIDIHTTARAHEWHSQLHMTSLFCKRPQRELYLIEKLMIDNVPVPLEDPKAVREALAVFEAYMAACPEIRAKNGATFPIPRADTWDNLPRTPQKNTPQQKRGL